MENSMIQITHLIAVIMRKEIWTKCEENKIGLFVAESLISDGMWKNEILGIECQILYVQKQIDGTSLFPVSHYGFFEGKNYFPVLCLFT